MQNNFSLKPYNTFGLDVHAAQFGTFKSVRELQDCLQQAAYDPWILGGGSNTLFVEDLQMSVLKNEIDGIEVLEENTREVILRAGAGVVWHDLVTWAVDRNLGGLENLALIPGSVGAAPIQNIGAYGKELTEVFVSLHAVRLVDGNSEVFRSEDCRFGYRDSIFKGILKHAYCITDVDLRLTKAPHRIETSYGSLHDVIEKKGIREAEIRDVYETVIEIRRSKLPDPAIIGNAGSFFKNPTIDKSQYQTLMVDYPQMPAFEVDDSRYKIPAGWLIEQCGWKGRRVGNVGCYEKQALVIVNYGNASGREIFDHAMRISDSVNTRFGILIHPEVNILP